MLITFVGTLTQTRIEVGRVTFPGKGSIRGQYVFLMAKSLSHKFPIIISGGSVSYFIEMVMLINLECTWRNKDWVGRVTLPSKRPMRGQYVFVMAKSHFFRFLFSIYISGDAALSYFIEMTMLICLECTLAQTRMGFGGGNFA